MALSISVSELKVRMEIFPLFGLPYKAPFGRADIKTVPVGRGTPNRPWRSRKTGLEEGTGVGRGVRDEMGMGVPGREKGEGVDTVGCEVVAVTVFRMLENSPCNRSNSATLE